MDRKVCFDIKAFPLQVLLRRESSWRRTSAGVVEVEKPQGKVIHLTVAALHKGIRPGMRFAEALSFDPHFRAASVSPSDLENARAELLALFHSFSMDVETDDAEPGVFWVRMRVKQGGKIPSLHDCGAQLEKNGFRFSAASGFTRFGTYVAARMRKCKSVRMTPLAFATPGEEDEFVERARLDALFLSEDLRAALELLGIETLGAYRRLPAGGLLERFGPEAYRLHRLASGEFDLTLKSEAEEIPYKRKMIFETPETNSVRLIFRYKRLLDELLAELTSASLVLSVFHPEMLLDNGETWTTRLAPAYPTNDSRLLSDLLYLKLEGEKVGRRLRGGVEEIAILVEGVAAAPGQSEMFQAHASRDPHAAREALARVRAEWGDDSVRRAALADGHFPEARFGWDMRALPGCSWFDKLTTNGSLSNLHESSLESLGSVRRWYHTARPIAASSIEIVAGPYLISGEWWAREKRRAYYFARDRAGALLWIYRDELDGRCHLQGRVE